MFVQRLQQTFVIMITTCDYDVVSNIDFLIEKRALFTCISINSQSVSDKTVVRMESLVAVAVFSRHGARSPFHSFNGDPYPCDDIKVWSNGVGQLTDEGREMMRKLGRDIRLRYGSLIQSDGLIISAKSSGAERCLESVQCILKEVAPNSDVKILANNRMLNCTPTDEDVIALHEQKKQLCFTHSPKSIRMFSRN